MSNTGFAISAEVSYLRHEFGKDCERKLDATVPLLCPVAGFGARSVEFWHYTYFQSVNCLQYELDKRIWFQYH